MPEQRTGVETVRGLPVALAAVALTLCLVIPRDDMVELWTVTARDVSRRRRRLSLYTFQPLVYGGGTPCIVGRFDAGLNGVLASHFPYCVKAADYYRLRELRNQLFCGRTLRCSLDPCARNAVQDAMGATCNDPAAARHWYQVVLAQQDRNGWLPHGIPLRQGVESSLINQIPHRDMNVWAPPALYFYLAETGDMDILEAKVPFRDDRTKATVYDHVCRGLEWLLKDRTKRKLSRIGEGDWNDPLNMAGPKGRGESVWLTEALVYALEVWAGVAERIGDTARATRYRKEADVSRRAINRHAWDRAWYVRGSTDAGKWFGTRRDRHGKLFLNAQSWALMCGAATGSRLRACIESVERHLATPSGPMTLWPAYQDMREDIGKLTLKTPGFGENGSCYCHAGAFYAFALFMVRKRDLGWQVMRSQLPGGPTNTLERAGQLPLYIPNMFNGLAAGTSTARSSGCRRRARVIR